MSTTGGRRPRIARAFLEEHRRRSFAAGAAELADEFGVREITVTMLCQIAHSARNTFYELFANGEECMRFAAGQGYELLFEKAPDPAGGPVEPAVATRSLCEAAVGEPALVRFLLFHSRGVAMGEDNPSAESAVARLATLFAARDGAAGGPGPREDFVAGVYVEMLSRRLVEGDPRAVAALPDELDPWALALLV
jgi:AcrR family transcriptional regulator